MSLTQAGIEAGGLGLGEQSVRRLGQRSGTEEEGLDGEAGPMGEHPALGGWLGILGLPHQPGCLSLACPMNPRP